MLPLPGRDRADGWRAGRATDARRAARYEDGDDPDDMGAEPPHRYEQPTKAGMIGFILSGVSLGLLLVVGILWYALSVENQQQNDVVRSRLMMLWLAFLDIGSFFCAVAATFFAGRGLSPTNTLYRGWSMAGLILGVVEIVLATFVGFMISCCALITLG